MRFPDRPNINYVLLPRYRRYRQEAAPPESAVWLQHPAAARTEDLRGTAP